MHLAQREVVELEVQAGRDETVGALLEGQGDVQAHGECPHLVGTAIGRLHDARPAAGADVQPLGAFAARAIGGHQPREQPRLVVVDRIAHTPLGQLQGRGLIALAGQGQFFIRILWRGETRAAEDHDGVLDAQLLLLQIGLQHLELETDAPRLAAQQEFGIGERQAVGIGQERLAGIGMGLQVGPGLGELAVFYVFC